MFLYSLLIEYLEQRVACAGERLRRTVCGDLIGVFAADEADTRNRNLRLNGKRHAGLKRSREAFGENRCFVHCQTDGVAEELAAVHKAFAERRIDEREDLLVNLSRNGTGAQERCSFVLQRNALLACRADHAALRMLVQLAVVERNTLIGMVAAPAARNVQQDGVAFVQRALGRALRQRRRSPEYPDRLP